MLRCDLIHLKLIGIGYFSSVRLFFIRNVFSSHMIGQCIGFPWIGTSLYTQQWYGKQRIHFIDTLIFVLLMALRLRTN